MRAQILKPPRIFKVKGGRRKDCGSIYLKTNEQITFRNDANVGEWDVTRMPWGYYATGSMNARLPTFGIRAALIRTHEPRYHIVLVEAGKEDPFIKDMIKSNYSVLTWFDLWT